MLNVLRAYDPDLVELPCGAGGILISPGLQGRIFARIGRELIHRLDTALLAAPSDVEFNNVGGNSLWPAPEGGPFAFNYLPDSDAWLVQPGIAVAVPAVQSRTARRVTIEKTIALTNRKGIDVQVRYGRKVEVQAPPASVEALSLQGVSYRSTDYFAPIGDYSIDDVLLAPWSLEQFPGSDGITAFGKFDRGDDPINFDFYGDPRGRIRCSDGLFTFELGGEDRHQIGIRIDSRPRFIGALDPERSMLIIRTTRPQNGVYFNIADNDQPQGPYSAADLFSVFNGGSLGFFELETVGAMSVRDGHVTASTLVSETLLLHGEMQNLVEYLSARGVELRERVA